VPVLVVAERNKRNLVVPPDNACVSLRDAQPVLVEVLVESLRAHDFKHLDELIIVVSACEEGFLLEYLRDAG
jgi:hypothetical protein